MKACLAIALLCFLSGCERETAQPIRVSLVGKVIKCQYDADLRSNVIRIENQEGTDSTGLPLDNAGGCDAFDFKSIYRVKLLQVSKDRYRIVEIEQVH
jgi:hypothetical protein